MKTCRWLAVVALLAGAAGLARAQEPPPGPPPGPEGAAPPPPQEVEKFVAELKGEDPAMGEELERMRHEHPEGFAHQARAFGPMLRDPEGRAVLKKNLRAEFLARRAVRSYKEAKDADERKKLEPDVKRALEAQFDAKMAAHEMQLKKMTAELAKLKDRIEKRRAQRAQLIDKRLRELTNDEEGWDW